MSTLGDAITDAIRRRQGKIQPKMEEDQDAVQQMAPEDQQVEDEKKNKRFAKIKQMLGFGKPTS